MSKEYRDAVRLGIELAWAKCLYMRDALGVDEPAEAEGAKMCAMSLKKLCDVCLDDDDLEGAKQTLLPLIAYKPEKL